MLSTTLHYNPMYNAIQCNIKYDTIHFTTPHHNMGHNTTQHNIYHTTTPYKVVFCCTILYYTAKTTLLQHNVHCNVSNNVRYHICYHVHYTACLVRALYCTYCTYHCLYVRLCSPSLSVISAALIALGRSCLLAKTNSTDSRSSSSFNIRWSSSRAKIETG